MELGWIPERGLLGLPAAYKIGGWYHSGEFDDLTEDINGDNLLITGLPARSRRGNGGYYFAIDQTLYHENDAGTEGLIWFGAFNFGPDEDRNILPFFYVTGLVYTGLIPGRPTDKTSLGFTGGVFRQELRDAQREAGQGAQRMETIIEFNYQYNITRWFYFRPDMQVILDPNGLDEIDDAVVLGFEVGVRF